MIPFGIDQAHTQFRVPIKPPVGFGNQVVHFPVHGVHLLGPIQPDQQHMLTRLNIYNRHIPLPSEVLMSNEVSGQVFPEHAVNTSMYARLRPSRCAILLRALVLGCLPWQPVRPVGLTHSSGRFWKDLPAYLVTH